MSIEYEHNRSLARKTPDPKPVRKRGRWRAGILQLILLAVIATAVWSILSRHGPQQRRAAVPVSPPEPGVVLQEQVPGARVLGDDGSDRFRVIPNPSNP